MVPHAADRRVLFWEVYNEPCEWRHFEAGVCTYFEVTTSTMIKELGYGWVTALKPTAPVISCWDELNNTFSQLREVCRRTALACAGQLDWSNQ